MSAAEFRRWQQFYSQEPVDETAIHIQLARIAAILHNANLGKNGKAVPASYFAPYLNPPKGEEDEGLSMDDNW